LAAPKPLGSLWFRAPEDDDGPERPRKELREFAAQRAAGASVEVDARCEGVPQLPTLLARTVAAIANIVNPQLHIVIWESSDFPYEPALFQERAVRTKPPNADQLVLISLLLVIVVSLQANVLVQLALAGGLTVLASAYNRQA
jgi:hypothetical protein